MTDMAASVNRGTMGDPNVGPKNTIVLIMVSPKKVCLLLGNPHLEADHRFTALSPTLAAVLKSYITLSMLCSSIPR